MYALARMLEVPVSLWTATLHRGAARWVSRSVCTATLGLGLLAAGCGDDTDHPPGPLGTTTGSSSSTGSAGGGGASGGGSTGAAGGGATETGELGPIEHVDIDDTPCVPAGGSAVALYPAATAAPVFGKLARIGSRWVTGGGIGLPGFVTFDADGSHADDLPATTLTGGNDDFTSEGDTIGQAGLDGSEIRYQRYSDAGQVLGSSLTLSSDGTWVEPRLAGGDGQSLVVWGSDGTLRARGVGPSGQLAGPAYDFGQGSFDSFLRVVVARRPGGFAVAWTGDSEIDTFTTHFVLVTLTDTEGPEVEITAAHDWPELSRLVKTPTGYALLLTGPAPDRAPYVLLLDETGARSSAAHRLVGAVIGADLAAQGDELGVLANRATGEPEFRPLAADLSPLGPWVCLEGPSGGSDDAGLDADGAGYAAVVRRPLDPAPDGLEIFTRFDRLGTGSP